MIYMIYIILVLTSSAGKNPDGDKTGKKKSYPDFRYNWTYEHAIHEELI